MISFSLLFSYIKGMKKEITLNTLSVLVFLILIQGSLIFAYNIQQRDISKCLNYPNDYFITFNNISNDNATVKSDFFIAIENFRSEIINLNFELDGLLLISEIDWLNETCFFLAMDSALLNRLIDYDIDSGEVLMSKPLAENNAIDIDSEIKFLNREFNVRAILNFNDILTIDKLVKGFHSRNSIDNGDVVVQNVLIVNINNIDNNFSFSKDLKSYPVLASFIIQYPRVLFEKSSPSNCLQQSIYLDNQISLNFNIFYNNNIEFNYDKRLSNDLSNIKKHVSINLLYYMGISIPFLICVLFLNRLITQFSYDSWRKQILKLWGKGFSKKKTFNLLITITLIIDSIIILCFLAILFFEAIVLGIIIDNSFILLICFMIILFIISLLFQVYEIYFLTYPENEKDSLMESNMHSIHSIIKFIRSKYKSHPKILVINILLALIGLTFLYNRQLFYIMHRILPMNNYWFFFLSSFITPIGLVLFLTGMIGLIIQQINRIYHFIREKIVHRKKDTLKKEILNVIFKNSIFSLRRLNSLLIILFFSFNFALLVSDSLNKELSAQTNYNILGDISISPYMIKNYLNANNKLSEIVNRTEVEEYTYYYKGSANILINEEIYETHIIIYDAERLPEFLSYSKDNLFEFNSFHKLFKIVQSNSNSVIIDANTYSKLSLKLNDFLFISGIINKDTYNINCTLVDVTRFNIVNPRTTLNSPVIFIPFSALKLEHSLINMHKIEIKLKKGYDSDEFREIFYEHYSFPLSAIQKRISYNRIELDKFINFIRVFSVITILVFSLIFIFILSLKSLQSLINLYSRGFSLRDLLNSLYSQLSLFWVYYSSTGILLSFLFFVMIKAYLAKSINQYFTLHFDVTGVTLIIVSSIFSILIPLLSSIFTIDSISKNENKVFYFTFKYNDSFAGE